MERRLNRIMRLEEVLKPKERFSSSVLEEIIGDLEAAICSNISQTKDATVGTENDKK